MSACSVSPARRLISSVLRVIFVFPLLSMMALQANADHGPGSHVNVGLSAPESSDGNYAVTWNRPTFYTVDLQEKFNSGSYSSVYQGNATSFSFTNKPAGTYTYRVRLFWDLGFYVLEGGYSGPITTTVVSGPAAPANITSPATSDTGFYSVTWDTSVGATSYELQRRVDGGSWSTIQNSGDTSRDEEALTDGTYEYHVRACIGPVCSAYSGISTTEVLLAGGTPTTTVFEDSFETDKGWSINPDNNDTASSGIWERATPTASNYQPGSPYEGSYQLVTGALASTDNSHDVDDGVTSIRSPDIHLPALSAGESLELELWHYIAQSSTSLDDYLKISVIGSTSSQVLLNSSVYSEGITSPEWRQFVARLDEFAGDTIYLLVEAADESSNSTVEAGIDAVSIKKIPTPSAIFSDDFETEQGWTVNSDGTDSATGGLWERAEPLGDESGYQAIIAHSPTHQLITGAQDHSDSVTEGLTSIRSPQINLPSIGAGEEIRFQLWKYFTHNDSGNGQFLRISLNTLTMTEVLYERASNDARVRQPSWTQLIRDISQYAGQTVHIVIEASSDVDEGEFVEAGIDDVLIELLPSVFTSPVVFNDDFETDQGWIFNPDGTDYMDFGKWERGDPVAADTQLDDAHSGSYQLITDASAATMDAGETNVQSPDIQLPVIATGEGLQLQFWQYLSFSTPSMFTPDDFLRVTLVGETSSRIIFEETSYADADVPPVWEEVIADISDFSGETINILITAQGSTFSQVDAGVDDVQIIRVAETQEPQPPTLEFISPSNGSSFIEGETITFEATATDDQGADISANIQWSSSVDGAIGSGQVLNYSGLSVNSHIVTAEVTDSNSLTAEFSIGITVLIAAPEIPPSITAPATDDDGAFIVNWVAASGVVTSYELEQQLDGGAWSQVYTGTALNHSLSGLAEGSYQHRVRACNSTGCSDYTASSTTVVDIPDPIPQPPASITVPAADDDGAFGVSWPAVTGIVEAYELEQQFNSGAWAQVYSGAASNHDLSGLSEGSYQHRVRACNTTGCSAYTTSTNTVVDIPDPIPGSPAAISVPTTPVTTAGFTVSWDAATGVVENYQLDQQVDGGSWTPVYTGAATSHALSGLANGSYVHRVKACNASGCSAETVSTATMVIDPAPDAPASISVPATDDDGAFDINWTAASGVVDSYEVEQQVDGGSWVQVYNGTALTHSLVGLVDGSYLHRVRACNATGCSADTTSTITIVDIPDPIPESPASITVPSSDDDGAFDISWPVANGVVDDYELEQQQDGGAWSPIYSGSALSFSVSGLVDDSSYVHRVRACNASGCSTYTTSIETLVDIPDPIPGAPVTISVPTTPVTTGGFTISWDAATGVVENYQLEQQVDGGSWTPVYTGAATSHALSGLANGSYVHRVKACNASGCSAETVSTATMVIDPAPDAPASISVPATDDDGAFDVGWATANGVVDNYELEQQQDSGAWNPIYTGNALSFSVSALADGSSYVHRVRACNTTGCSAYTTSTTTLVDIPDPIPEAPASITVPATSALDSFQVNWASVSGIVDNYVLEQQKDGGAWQEIFSGNGLSHTASGLTNGNYVHRVKACNASGCSAYQTSQTTVVSLSVTGWSIQHFQYDELGRLTTFNSDTGSYAGYHYDPANNRTLIEDDADSVDSDGDGQLNGVDSDDDNDGMPDTWEVTNSFNPLSAADASEDADGDGATNLGEYQAGTDPLDPNSN